MWKTAGSPGTDSVDASALCTTACAVRSRWGGANRTAMVFNETALRGPHSVRLRAALSAMFRFSSGAPVFRQESGIRNFRRDSTQEWDAGQEQEIQAQELPRVVPWPVYPSGQLGGPSGPLADRGRLV
jgi:hypothetical protein